MYRNHTAPDIARELGRTPASVQSKAHALGLPGTKTKKHMKSRGRKA
jgi:hypothetical protein